METKDEMAERRAKMLAGWHGAKWPQDAHRYRADAQAIAASDEAAGKVTVQGWQGIESAPRDGTVLELGVPGRRLGTGFWSDWNNYWTTGENDRMRDHVMMQPQPTRWTMPLPPPPTATEERT